MAENKSGIVSACTSSNNIATVNQGADQHIQGNFQAMLAFAKTLVLNLTSHALGDDNREKAVCNMLLTLVTESEKIIREDGEKKTAGV